MSRFRPLLIVVLLIAAAVIAWRFLGPRPRAPYLSGYIVGDNLDLGASVSGTVASIAVADGQRVSAGQALFRIAPATLEAQGEQAAANIRANQTQISTAEANLRQAQASVAASEATAERARRDLARLEFVKRDDPAAVANKDIDEARASYREAQANVIAARKAVDARSAEIGQSPRSDRAGDRRQAKRRYPGRATLACCSSRWARPARLLPTRRMGGGQPTRRQRHPGRRKVKVRFFVPETERSRATGPGKTVRFSCDGCAAGLTGRISYVSPDPNSRRRSSSAATTATGSCSWSRPARQSPRS